MASENFNQFGPTFQSKIISSLLSDNKFIQTISDILESTYFDSDANKWLSKEISKYFMEYRKAPTLEVLKIKINQITIIGQYGNVHLVDLIGNMIKKNIVLL